LAKIGFANVEPAPEISRALAAVAINDDTANVEIRVLSFTRCLLQAELEIKQSGVWVNIRNPTAREARGRGLHLGDGSMTRR
jgi:hypothetical protein